MSDREAFWNAICAEPDEDSPRLVYADWLDDHGEHARAELIRVQCALAHLTEADADRWTLGDRERALERTHGQAWRDGILNGVSLIHFQRGFPVLENEIDSETLLADVPRFMQVGPVQELRLRVRSSDPAALAACPGLGRVGSLFLHLAGRHPDVLFRILESSHLSRLTGLGIETDRLGRSGPRRLADWPGLAHLRKLTLVASDVTLPELKPLFLSPHLEGLRQLRIVSLAPDSDVTLALAASPTLRSLEELSLGDGFDEAGVIRFAETLSLPALRSLAIRGPELGVPGATALARCAPLASLRRLALNAGQLGPTAAGVLAASPTLRGLEVVEFDAVDLDNRALQVLAGGFLSTELRVLSLVRTRIDDAGLEALTRANLSGLRCLNLSFCAIRGHGIASLARAPWAPGLRVLNLCGCPLDDEAIHRLAAAPLHSLRSLELTDTNLSERGVQAILRADWLGGLRRLSLYQGQPFDSRVTRDVLDCPHLRQLWELHVHCDRDDPLREQLAERFGIEFKYDHGDDIPF